MSTKSLANSVRKAIGNLTKHRINAKRDYPTVSVSAAPTAIPLHEIIIRLPSLFPRSYNDSVRDYNDLCRDSDEKFQEELLKTLPFFGRSDETKRAEVIRTPIDDDGNYINEFCIMPKNACRLDKLKHLVFIHGYGAGMGFFLKNLENIPLLNDEWCIHAIDLPGYGFSSRCRFPFHYPTDTVTDVHNWFHSRVHRWFQRRDLLQNPQNNIIMAHSLGAYLMALYSSKFPTHFKKIIMCSPAGICHSTTAKAVGNANPPWWYTKLWDRNISPFSLVRGSSRLGSKLTSGWTYRRFRKLLHEKTETSKRQFEALHRYTYAIFNKQGCGEYLLSFALRCGGDPRIPLEDTLFKRKDSGLEKGNIEWLWLYGERDWMDANGGRRVSQCLNENHGHKSEVFIVPDAGHHLYFDNYEFFNKIIVDQMKSI